jgi:hypothetical protein
MTAMSATAESSLNFVPRELHDRSSPMYVVRRQRRVAQRDEQRSHLCRRQRVASLDRGLAGNRRSEALVSRVCASFAIAGERRECLAETPFRIEARMWHGHSAHEERVTAESFDLETQSLEQLTISLERLALRWTEMQRHREQQALSRLLAMLERAYEFFI